MRSCVALVALVLCAWPAPVSTRLASPDEQHVHSVSAQPVERMRRRTIPPPALDDIALVDAHGRPVALAAAIQGDAPVLLNFIFTTCTTICPVMSTGFARLESRLREAGRPVRLISISIDPEVDTPARLRDYAARHGAGPHWTLLTGAPPAVVAAQRAFGAYRGGKDNHQPATYVRRSAAGEWQQLVGLQSLEALLLAYDGR